MNKMFMTRSEYEKQKRAGKDPAKSAMAAVLAAPGSQGGGFAGGLGGLGPSILNQVGKLQTKPRPMPVTAVPSAMGGGAPVQPGGGGLGLPVRNPGFQPGAPPFGGRMLGRIGAGGPVTEAPGAMDSDAGRRSDAILRNMPGYQPRPRPRPIPRFGAINPEMRAQAYRRTLTPDADVIPRVPRQRFGGGRMLPQPRLLGSTRRF